MTNAQASALAKMQARNAALTPEERKARSAKAAEASKRAAKARAAAGSTTAPVKTETVKAQEAAQPEQSYTWRVLLLTDKGASWHTVESPGMQRACRAARKANEGAMVRGCVRADVPSLPEFPKK